MQLAIKCPERNYLSAGEKRAGFADRSLGDSQWISVSSMPNSCCKNKKKVGFPPHLNYAAALKKTLGNSSVDLFGEKGDHLRDCQRILGLSISSEALSPFQAHGSSPKPLFCTSCPGASAIRGQVSEQSLWGVAPKLWHPFSRHIHQAPSLEASQTKPDLASLTFSFLKCQSPFDLPGLLSYWGGLSVSCLLTEA